MKKHLRLMLILITVFALVACGTPSLDYPIPEEDGDLLPSACRELYEIRRGLEADFFEVEISDGNGYQKLTASRVLSWVIVIRYPTDDKAAFAITYWQSVVPALRPQTDPNDIVFVREGRNLAFSHTRIWRQDTFPNLRIGSAMEDVHRNTRHWTYVTLDGVTDPDFAEYFEFTHARMQIRGRGQSSWRMAVGDDPWAGKRPFRLRFADQRDTTRPQNDFIRPILNSGFAAREWTFIANQSDKSLLRNYSAYYLARLLDGMPFAPNAQLVNVYMAATRRTTHSGESVTVNNPGPYQGEYVFQGVYQMSDQLNQPQAGRVNITVNEDPTVSEFLFEMCFHELFRWRNPNHYTSRPGWPRPHVIINYLMGGGMERPFMIEAGGGEDVDGEPNVVTVQYAQRFLQNVDGAIRSQNFARLSQWIDIPSFIDFYLVQELYKNVDINTSSVRFTIRGQGENRRLYAGPVWDFDIAAGNAVYMNYHHYNFHGNGYRPTGTWVTTRSPWFGNFMATPEVRGLVRARWSEIQHREVRQMLDHIDEKSDIFENCFNRNFERWQIMGIYVWPNPPGIVDIITQRGQADHLIEYLEERGEWLSAWL